MARVILMMLVLGMGSSALASPAGVTPAGEAERLLLDDADDGILNDFNLIQAGLVASGVVWTEDIKRFDQDIARLVARARTAVAGAATQRERARLLFEFLHEKVLTAGYDFHGVDIPGLLKKGRYNCVSATLVYNALLEKLGIECAAILLPSHVFSTVKVDGVWVEVETTSPRGFDPVRTADEYQRFLEERRLSTDGSSLEKGQDRPALIKELEGRKERVENRTLVALIYSNIGVARIRDRDLTGAMDAFAKASHLARGLARFQKSRDSMIANMAFQMLKDREFGEARAFMDRVAPLKDLGPELRRKFSEWRLFAYSSQALVLIGEQQWDGAAVVLREGLAEFPGDKLLLNNLEVLFTKRVSGLIDAGRLEEAWQVGIESLDAFSPVPDAVGHNFAVIVEKLARQVQGIPGREREAITITSRALELARAHSLKPGPLEIIELEQASCWFRLADYLRGARLFRDGYLEYQRPVWRNNYSACLVNLASRGFSGDPDAALELLVEGSGILSGDREVLAALWTVVLEKAARLLEQGSAARARTLLEGTARLGLPQSREDLLRIYHYRNLDVLIRLGDYDACRVAARRALSLFPRDRGLEQRAGECE